MSKNAVKKLGKKISRETRDTSDRPPDWFERAKVSAPYIWLLTEVLKWWIKWISIN